MICPFCKEEIIDGSIKCKHCLSILVDITNNQSIELKASKNKTIATSITSLVLGIIIILTLGEDDRTDLETTSGLLMFSIGSIITGLISIIDNHRGKGMAIAGLIMGILGLFSCLSVLL